MSTPDPIVISLRVSIARLAQAAGVQTPDLPVLGLPFEALVALATDKPRGWHGLCACITEELTKRQLPGLVCGGPAFSEAVREALATPEPGAALYTDLFKGVK